MKTKMTLFRTAALIVLLFLFPGMKQLHAQLATGDIAFTGYNAATGTSAAEFSFVVLKATGIPASTTVYFTDNGWNTTLATPALGTSEGTITWTSGASTLVQFSEVKFTASAAGTGALTVSNGTASVTTGTFLLSGSGDQILAYIGSSGSPTSFISGIQMNAESGGLGANASTLSGWDDMVGGTSPYGYSANRSGVPTGLVTGTNAVMPVDATNSPYVEYDDAKYNCTGSNPASSLSGMATSINDWNNWSKANSSPYTLPSNCSFSIGTPPSITGQPSNQTVCAGAGTATFTITASNAVTYQWQEKVGAGSFTNITNGGVYGGATTASLTITNPAAGMSTNQYQCVVTGTAAPNATSNAVTLTVNSAPSITAQPSNATTCAAASTSFTAGTSNATTYQWQVSTNGGSSYANVTNGGVYSNATTTTLNITGATVAMNGYMYQLIATGTCSPTATSSAATLTVNDPGNWVGGTDANWNTTANWGCGALPTATTNVTISSTATFQPQVNITSAICNNITIGSGASLSFTGTTNVLEVKGNFTNNGTLSAANGKLKISGTTAQTVPAGAYKDFELAGSGTKTAQGAISISGTLTLTSGYLQLGVNDLTLGNSASISGATFMNAAPTSYIITNSTGQLKIQNIGPGGKTGVVVFPIGTSSASYTPLTIQNTGVIDVFGGRVINNVYKSYTAAGIPNGPQQNTYNVGKTWNITEATAGGSTATVEFGWNENNDEQPGFNNGACFASHYYNGGWQTVLPAAPANDFAPTYSKSISVTSFSPFAVGSQFSILPLDLLSFTGKAVKDGTALNWTTANEKNVAGFDVERATDGRSYQRVGNVPARANNSTTETTYNYADAVQAKGTLYYRLKMTDNDGTFKYSNTITVNASGNGPSFTVYPNPVDGTDLHIQMNGTVSAAVEVKITDMTGRVWYVASLDAETMNKGVVPVSIKSLPAGIYQLHISGDAINETSRFTKL